MEKYIYKNIPANESILIEGKVHWGILLFPGTLLILSFLAHMFLTDIIRNTGAVKTFKVFGVEVFSANILASIVGIVFFVILLMIGAMLVSRGMRILASGILVTDRKVIIKTGVFRTWLMESPIEKINGIVMEQSFLGRLFEYGSIYIHTTSGSFFLRDVSSPGEIKAVLNDQMLRLEDWKAQKQAETFLGFGSYDDSLSVPVQERRAELPRGNDQVI
jgi:uncharacterized membrane protein YdbT with pleckstrin-like domain